LLTVATFTDCLWEKSKSEKGFQKQELSFFLFCLHDNTFLCFFAADTAAVIIKMERASVPPRTGFKNIERPLIPPRSASLANGGRHSRSQPQPKSSFRNALVRVPVPRRLLDGVNVLRVNANGRTRPSFLTLSEDKFTLYITTTKRGPAGGARGLSLLGLRRSKSEGETHERTIDIGAIDRVQRGQGTTKFELAKKSRRDYMNFRSSSFGDDASEATIAALDPKRSFSIIFRGERTLDLMVLEEDQRDDILDALDNVLRAYQAAKLRVTNEVLLLRHIWLDVDKVCLVLCKGAVCLRILY